MPCACYPREKDGHAYVQWIGTGFSDCIYSAEELASFYLGLSSILIWCFCQAPQFYTNYKRGSVEALSKWFLIIWLSGDITNLAGAVLTNQLPTQQYTAMLFVSLDVCMVCQYSYYNLVKHALQKRGYIKDNGASGGGSEPLLGDERPNTFSGEGTPARPRQGSSPRRRASFDAAGGGSHPPVATGSVVALAAPAMLACAALGLAWTRMDGAHAAATASSVAGAGADSTAQLAATPPLAKSCIKDPVEDEWVHTMGVVLGWMSSTLYMGSRVPQVYRNHVRKSVAGLSWVMFLSAVLGNTTYGISVILRLHTTRDLVAKLPWLIGSLGTLVFDFTILVQLSIYSKPRGLQRPATGYTPVLRRDGSVVREREPPRLSKSSLAVFVVGGDYSPAFTVPTGSSVDGSG